MHSVDPNELIGTNKSVIYWLHRSGNDDRFSVSGATKSHPRRAGMPWPPQKLPSDDCPSGVFKMAMEPILDWAEHLDEIVVKFKKGVSHELPDRLSFDRYTIVSARCRELFERIDPDGGHIYLPASLATANKRSVDGEWFYMWCGRSFLSDSEKNTAGVMEDAITNGFHYEYHLATTDRCKFFEDMPMWTVVGTPGPEYMSQAIFAQVKDAGLTGFREYTKRWGWEYEHDNQRLTHLVTTQNVSHIWF